MARAEEADDYDELLVAHHRLLHEHRCLLAAHADTGPERKQIEDRHAEIETWLRVSLDARERELHAMQSSTSWRITKPFRWSSGKLLALRHRLTA